MNRYQTGPLAVGLALLFVFTPNQAEDAHGFEIDATGWNSALGSPIALGNSVDVTWSIAPDGTTLPGGSLTPGSASAPSGLIAMLDGIHGVVQGGHTSDLTQRPWFQLFESSFERWDSLAGISYQYESNDDGVPFSPFNAGVLGPFAGFTPGTRGDTRIGARSTNGNVLGYANFPHIADIVISTNPNFQSSRWGVNTGNYQITRFVLMHEIGHALGLRHVITGGVFDAVMSISPATAAFGFDGPQLDDILGVQRLYGDANEKGLGNDTVGNATSLGSLLPGSPIAIGTDGDSLAVAFTDVDFLSIGGAVEDLFFDNHSLTGSPADVDVFSFTIESSSLVDILLTPKGPTYDVGREGGSLQTYDASAQNDLNLELLDVDGTTVLAFSSANGLGVSEEILGFLLAPGEYFVRIQVEQGSDAGIQLYQLDLTASVIPEPTSLALLIAAVFCLPYRLQWLRR